MARIYINTLLLVVAGLVFAAGCQRAGDKERQIMSETPKSENLKTATFAGGCFWCMEVPFEQRDGISTVISGYAGGTKPNPTYEEVATGRTQYVEAVQITYDEDKISYGELLDIFWRQIDPTDAGGSFVDRGRQYRSVIFYHDAAQRQEAEASKQALAESMRFNRPIATEIRPFTTFYEAEDYHQDFHKKSPVRYKTYRQHSGRDQFIEMHWKEAPAGGNPGDNQQMAEKTFRKPPDSVLKQKLTPLQYKVTQEDGTEPPFQNEYWDNKKAGIYVDIVSGEPLFSSTDKYKSGTGWPSFTKPITMDAITTKTDRSLFMTRIEVRSRYADSHLGHVFDDGPQPTGKRFCMNSAALRFIPVEDLEKEGYGEFKSLFE